MKKAFYSIIKPLKARYLSMGLHSI